MQSFDTPAPIAAILDIPAGRLRLIAGDRTDTTVEVRPADPAKGRDVRAAEQAVVECRDDTLRITTTAKNQILGASGSVEVTVHLPAGSRVQVTAAGVELRATGRLGEVVFDGAHGEITLDEAASVRVTTSAGDVTVGRLHGPGQISTEKGDLRIAEAVGGAVVLRTQAGSISIDAAAGVSAALDAGTGHGRITNSLRNDGVATLDIHASTAYGDIVARAL